MSNIEDDKYCPKCGIELDTQIKGKDDIYRWLCLKCGWHE